MDSLLSEQFPLPKSPVSPGAGADFSLCIDNPLPWDIGSPAQRGHGIPDHPSRAPVHDLGDLAVGGNLARGIRRTAS